MSLKKFAKAFEVQFPQAWYRVGDFHGTGELIFWSGEDNFVNGMPLFDYREECGYDIHPKLVKLAALHGFYFECYDAGTYLATEI
jgi:hypothetical protein